MKKVYIIGILIVLFFGYTSILVFGISNNYDSPLSIFKKKIEIMFGAGGTFPAFLPSYTSVSATSALTGHADDHNSLHSDVTAIATKIGTGSSNASSASADDVLTADGSGGTSWGAQTGAGYAEFTSVGDNQQPVSTTPFLFPNGFYASTTILFERVTSTFSLSTIGLFGINGDWFTDLTGSNLSIDSSGVLNAAAGGTNDWEIFTFQSTPFLRPTSTNDATGLFITATSSFSNLTIESATTTGQIVASNDCGVPFASFVCGNASWDDDDECFWDGGSTATELPACDDGKIRSINTICTIAGTSGAYKVAYISINSASSTPNCEVNTGDSGDTVVSSGLCDVPFSKGDKLSCKINENGAAQPQDCVCHFTVTYD